ncbi:MAG: flagellar motor switch protein FliG [Deltaproteobacteria bacterium]|nr:MAG: flagellar motor switch protein FliG [Deltaproteobacteria bacterium]
MTNEEKVAVLLLSLKEEVTADIMKNFGPDEIKRIGKRMKTLSSISDVDIGHVAKEFCALAQKKGNRIISVQDNVVESIIVKTLGEDKGKEFIKSIDEENSSSDSQIIEKLRNTDSKRLIEFTKMEHPQTTALILAHLRPEQTAEILDSLPSDRQKDIVARITTLGSVPREFLEEMTKTLESEMIVDNTTEEQVGGARMMAEILNRMNQSNEKAILESLEETDPDMASEIKNLMFTFDDIFRLDDIGMRTLLEEINREDLARALKIVDDEIKEKVFKNISSRAAEMLKEDMAEMPPVRLSDVEKSQRMIIETAKRLEAEDKILFSGSSEEDAFV